MTRSISTYDDLLAEKQRLTILLQAQKDLVRQDIQEIKEELAPVKSAISMVGKFATRDKGNWLLTTAADKVIDLVFKKMILSKAGWVTKLAVPFLMKNFSSHVIADNKDGIVNKLFSLFTRKKAHANGKMPVEADESED
jgi:hypothetical protein